MAKKGSTVSFLYLIGMILTGIGFSVPIFKLSGIAGGIAKFAGSLTGKSHLDLINGFQIVSQYDGEMKVAALLVFIGAVAGIILYLAYNKALYKMIALIVSVAGGFYLFLNTSDMGISFAKEYLFVGFYMIVAGWILALIGLIVSKK